MQSSTALFSLATPILWSAHITLDIFIGLTVSYNWTLKIDIDEDALAQIETANLLGEEIRAGTLPWRWRNYLRSVRSINLNLTSSFGWPNRKFELEASALAPHLPETFDALSISKRIRECVSKESLARQEAWIEWLLGRRFGGVIAKHVILCDMTLAEMDPFLRSRIKKFTWRRDDKKDVDIKDVLFKINDIEALVFGGSSQTDFFLMKHGDFRKIADVVESFRSFKYLSLNIGCPPCTSGQCFPPRLTRFSCRIGIDGMGQIEDILTASRSQLKEFDMDCGNFKHVKLESFKPLLSTLTELTKLDLELPKLRYLTLFMSTLINLQELRLTIRSDREIIGKNVVCLPKLRHLEIHGHPHACIKVHFGIGLQTIFISYAHLVIDYQLLRVTGMPRLEELTLDHARKETFPFYDHRLAELLEDPAVSPALARVDGLTIQRLKRHVKKLKYGHA
ncbi:hypothetical protein HK101_010926 [Irineochytrium annulatum]|nr:hypothetical protein HK101_010926 [Irineochytrium annulatum]